MANLKKIGLHLMALFVLSVLCSHDYFLVPNSFFLQKGDTLQMHLLVGDRFHAELERPVQKYITEKYDWHQAGSTQDMLTVYDDGHMPVMDRVMDSEGLGMVAMERRYAKITMKSEKFTSYLEEERLYDILNQRKEMKPRPEEREKYTRYLKSLVRVGEADGDIYKRRLGHRLEIILLQNPYALKGGEEMTAQLFLKGKPLKDGSLDVVNQDDNGKVSSIALKSDADGKIRFRLDKSGKWMIRITYMEQCIGCEDADWESYWSSYTFGFRK